MLSKPAIRGILVVFCLFFLGIVFYLFKPQSAFAVTYNCSDSNQLGCWFIKFTAQDNGTVSWTSNLAPASPGSATMIAGLQTVIRIGSGTCPAGGPYADITFNFVSLPDEVRHVTSVNLSQVTYCNYADTYLGNVPTATCANGLITNSSCSPQAAITWYSGCTQNATISWTTPSGGSPNNYRILLNGVETNVALALSYSFNTARNTSYNWAVRAEWNWGYNQWPIGGSFTSYGNAQCAPPRVSLTGKCVIGGGTIDTRTKNVTYDWGQPSPGGAPTSYTLLVKNGLNQTTNNITGIGGGTTVYTIETGMNIQRIWNITAVYGSLGYSLGDSVADQIGDCVPGALTLSFTYTCTNGIANPTAHLSWTAAANNSMTDVVRYDVDRADTAGGAGLVTLATGLAGTTYATNVTRGQSYFFRIKAYYPNERFGTDFTGSNMSPGGVGAVFIGVATNMNGQLNSPLCDADITNAGPYNLTLPRKTVANTVNTSITITKNRGWDSTAWPISLWIGDENALTKANAQRCYRTGSTNAVPIATDVNGNATVKVLCPDLDSNNNIVFPSTGINSVNTLAVTIEPTAVIQNLQNNVYFKVFACDTAANHADGFSLNDLNAGDPSIVATDCIRSNAALVTIPFANLTASGLHCDKANNRYTVGDAMTCWVTISNAAGASNSNVSNVGFWRYPPDGNPNPPCPTGAGGTTGGTPIAQPSLGALDGGTSTPVDGISATFLVGGIGTHTLYAVPNFACAAWETDYSVPPSGPSQLDNLTYSVDSQAWFKTTEGDIGNGNGDINLSYIGSGATDNTADYLIAAYRNLITQGTTVKSKNGWYLKNYTQPQSVPSGSVYNYLWGRFKDKVQGLTSHCSFDFTQSGWYYCAGSPSVPAAQFNYSGDPIIWFVNGDLTISNNIINDSPNTKSAIIVVSGKITVATSVTQVDAVLVSGNTFQSVGGVANVEGTPLQINGAVYAANVNLLRSCNTSPLCNSTIPAEVVNYQPRYLKVLKDWLGSSTVSWQEVAP